MASYLEDEEQTLVYMCGLSEGQFLRVAFGGSFVDYKSFALDRQELRRRGHRIQPVILDNDVWKMMKFGDTTIEAWLRMKYRDMQQRLKGLFDAERAEK